MLGRLKDILHQKQPIKVLVLGDVILDEYIWGNVQRISPEAPVQILESTSENKVLGGAANVANNLNALQCEVYLCGRIGDDDQGKHILELLKMKGIHSDGIFIDPARPTTHKTRLIGHSQQILRIDREDKQPISDQLLKRAISYLMKIIPDVDGIICSDYQKGFLVNDLMRQVIHRAHTEKVKIVLDPKGSDYSRYKGVDVMTPNLQEIKQASTLNVTDEKGLDQAVQHAFELTQASAILVTLGKEGMILYKNGGDRIHISTEAREVYDITGAGDTVISVFGLGLFSNADLIDTAHLASKAAGIVIGKLGTATVSREELARYLDDGPSTFTGKIVNLDECKQALSHSRGQGKRTVFTNGCFDILHIGHIQYLQAARTQGDLLVVGLNDDLSVREIKGPGRPILGEMERARILSALDCVDYVILFSESTPKRLITELRPDVLVKGGDYTLDQVVGREIVEGYGGCVKLIPLVPGQSTSKIVQSIIERYSQPR